MNQFNKDKTFLLRLPKELHVSLKKIALEKDIALHELIINVLTEFISKTKNNR